MMRLIWAAIAALTLVVIAFGYVVVTRVINPPAPFVFLSTALSQHEVIAGQHLTMIARAEVRGDAACYTGATRILRFSDRSEARVPGERTTAGPADRQTITYDLVIPLDAPSGPATLTVKEVYTCGVRIEVPSPAIRFMIRGAIEPGVDRFYDGRRDD
jgi:hypothetical protein